MAKTYQINGFNYQHVTCSARRADKFVEEFGQATTNEARVVLAQSVLTYAGETKPEPVFDWLEEVDMEVVMEVLNDFFYKSIGITSPQQRSLIESAMRDPEKYGSIIGRRNG